MATPGEGTCSKPRVESEALSGADPRSGSATRLTAVLKGGGKGTVANVASQSRRNTLVATLSNLAVTETEVMFTA